MGGIGSGRRVHVSARETVEDYRLIDVRQWQREGLLDGERSFSWRWSRHGEVIASIGVQNEPGQLILSYKHRTSGGEWKDEAYPVKLDWTDCHLGGARPWFLCPVSGCSRRVAILYAGEVFACRHCLRLAYPSQREMDLDRVVRRADRIRDRLGWEPGILNGPGPKPKGMHWRTFEGLSAAHDAYVDMAVRGAEKRFGIRL